MSERERVAREVRVVGNVQGVFFRASTQARARDRGVSGWVRNAADGAVEAWLEGPPDAVDAVVDWMRAGGPELASVADAEIRDVDPEGHERFEIRG